MKIVKIENSSAKEVFDIETPCHNYILENGVISHNSMDQYAPPVISGGSGILYAASTLIGLSKRKLKEGTEQIGNDIRCTLYKSRFTKETSQVFVGLHYDTGLDKYHGLLEIAEAVGVFVKDGTRFNINGTKVFGTTIMKNPEKYFTQEVLELIDSKCKKHFCYGQGGDETIAEVLDRAEAPIDAETGEILIDPTAPGIVSEHFNDPTNNI